ncbi:MAG: hypothetical protein LBB75_02955 [Oscillospiraceae bacterium]|jgi:hypothetical protein|nr:hypothetical protein [Oscillospiraceae bacterium]
MKLAKNRKVLVAISIALALIIGASATFAWITSKNSIANEFRNEGFAKGNGLVVSEEEEEFGWEGFGTTQPKHVTIVNTGESPMLARVTFEEMIKLLGDGGNITRSTSATPGVGMSRVPFNNAGIAGWAVVEDLNNATFDIVPDLPLNVTLYKSGSIYKARYEYTEGVPPVAKYQLVDFIGKLNPAGTVLSWDNTNADLTKRGLQYLYYTDGVAAFDSWNDKHNYTPWETPSPRFDPVTEIAGHPANAANSSVRPADIHFVYDSTFAAGVTGLLSTYKDKWYYNPLDGYFYYMGVVPGGGSTAQMLTGVTLDGNANQMLWQKYEYTLVVCVEGLQANKEALSDLVATGTAAGWKLGAGDLLDALEAVIDDYFA